MASYKILLLESALSDLHESISYYNDKKAGLGEEFEEEIFLLIELITKNPFLFPIKHEELREAIVRRFPYVIVYAIIETNVYVVSVFFAKMNPIRKSETKLGL